jgi:hypothetical protein
LAEWHAIASSLESSWRLAGLSSVIRLDYFDALPRCGRRAKEGRHHSGAFAIVFALQS